MKKSESQHPATNGDTTQQPLLNIANSDIILKPSQALCLHILKKNVGKFISTYAFRAEGVSHPAGRIQDSSEKGFEIDRSYLPAVDEFGNEHDRVGWYRLMGGVN